jgi:hypothetical protein
MEYFAKVSKDKLRDYQRRIDQIFGLKEDDYYFEFDSRKRRIMLFC